MNWVHMFEGMMLAWTSIILVLLAIGIYRDNDVRVPAILAGLQAIVLSVVFVLGVFNII